MLSTKQLQRLELKIKNMKKMALLFLTIFIFQSCSDEKDCCTQIPGNDILFEFSIINQNGEDLLDVNTQDTYNTDIIKLYDLINDDELLISNPESDAPKGYRIFKKDGINLIRPYFNVQSNLLTHKGIIQWSSNNQDSISLEMIQQSENVKRLIRIKYNNEVVWDENTAVNSDYRYFQIVK